MYSVKSIRNIQFSFLCTTFLIKKEVEKRCNCNWVFIIQFLFVPIRMTGGSAETDCKRKARARRQVKEDLFHLGGRAVDDE